MRWYIVLALVSLSLLILTEESEGWWTGRRRRRSSTPSSTRRSSPSSTRRRSSYTRRRRSSRTRRSVSQGCGYLYCYNGGTKYCRKRFWSSKKVAKCRCLSWTKGPQCQTITCPGKSCSKAGKAYCKSRGVTACRCYRGYYGSNCQYGCPPKSCYNGGKKYCVKGGFLWRRKRSKCKCPRGFGGHDCSKGCPPKYCYNRGRKYCVGNIVKCRCRRGFSGHDCREVQKGLAFYLTTKKNKRQRTVINDYDARRLRSSGYDGNKRTVMIIHGFTENANADWMSKMRDALIRKEDVNVIVVGWNAGRQRIEYFKIARRTRSVGSMVANMIKFINKVKGNTPASFHLIGFSLGAHVSGYAGKEFKNPKLGRISGLDPAGPEFANKHIDKRLDPTDATFVDVIHTNAGLLGLTTVSGHLDFWPNGGRSQPGSSSCVAKLGIGCSHTRAHELYLESINSRRAFRSYRCSSWYWFKHGKCMNCAGNSCPEMGYNAYKYKGLAGENFYLYTNGRKPFCVSRYVLITFKTSSKYPGYYPVIIVHGTKGSSQSFTASRMFTAGSSERVIVPLGNADVGNLKSIEVSHSETFAHNNPKLGWNLEKVTIQFMDKLKESYQACFKGKRVYNKPIKKKLTKGKISC